MPPRKKAQPQPLKGCVIAFCGNFYGRNQTSLLDDAVRLGAHTAKSVTKTVTHLIATQTECDKLSSKITQAQSQNVFIVNINWLDESDAAGKKKPEADYALTPPWSSGAAAAASPSPMATAVATPPSTDDNKKINTIVDLSKKRPASDDQAPDTKKFKLDNEKAPPVGKSQLTKDTSLRVPVDDGILSSDWAVYIGDDGVIWDATLNQTNAGKNNNKFYRVQLHHNPTNSHFQTWTRWGRVGDYGQTKVWGDGTLADALSQFQKKFKDKSGLTWENRADAPRPNKYVFLERSYESDDEDAGGEDAEDDENSDKKPEQQKPPPCTLDPAVKSVIKVIFNQDYVAATMASMNYDAQKMPLGKLSKATIMRGFQTLKDLTARLDGSSTNSDLSVEQLSNLFYSLIPHHFGRNRPPIINNLNTVKSEIELLETLVDLKESADLLKSQIDTDVHPLDRQYRGLGMKEMTPLSPADQEYRSLETYLQSTCGHTHLVRYTVQNIFRIQRQGEFARFDEFCKAPRDRRLLWHGSRATNFGGILSQGLRIAPPEAPVSGYMFGKGVYLADMSSKSAGYCYSYISGGTALLLLCEAELGPMRELTAADSQGAENAKQAGKWSTWGQGSQAPPVWDDAAKVLGVDSFKGVKIPSPDHPPTQTGVNGRLLYNEFICYDVAQIRLRYLFQVKMS